MDVGAPEKWAVEQFTSNVYHLSQQKGSRLAGLVRKESFKGKTEYFDTLGKATATAYTPRFPATPNLEITHERRALTTSMYHWATIVDRKDKLAMIHNPENEYAVAARNALGRKMDEIILASAFGTAKTGADGSGSQVLPTSQKIACVASGALAKLNLAGLQAAALKFDENEVVGSRNLYAPAGQIMNLLTDTTITSSDFNTVKALVNGEINTFMGFNFVKGEIADTAANYDEETFKFNTSTGLYDAGGTALGGTEEAVLCWISDGIILGMNEGMVGKIDERKDLSYCMQVYASMDFGGVRMEDVKVVQLICKA